MGLQAAPASEVMVLNGPDGEPVEFTVSAADADEAIITSPEGEDLGLKMVLHPSTGIPTLEQRAEEDDLIEYAQGETGYVFNASAQDGVGVPAGYIYNPQLSPSARHDYCTKSPDQFPSPGLNADFSRACARHDICMDRADAAGIGYGGCNNQLWEDMGTVCRNVYSSGDPRRLGCEQFRATYFVAVTTRHLNNI